MEPPNCRLFLRAGRSASRDCLEAALSAGDVASLLIGEGVSESMARELLALAQPKGVAVLVETDAALARRLGADGVQAADATACQAARQALGPDAIVGVRCASKHEAMEAGEAGADYVALPSGPGRPEESLAAWCAELFVIPCVAFDPAELDIARGLAAAGVDFVRPPERMWESPEAARKEVRETLAAIAGARA